MNVKYLTLFTLMLFSYVKNYGQKDIFNILIMFSMMMNNNIADDYYSCGQRERRSDQRE